MLEVNLTPLRMRALRIIQQRPWIDAQTLGTALNERGYDWNHPGQATRFGAKQVTPLIAAGLVYASRHGEGGYPITAGWRALTLTQRGLDALLGRQAEGDE